MKFAAMINAVSTRIRRRVAKRVRKQLKRVKSILQAGTLWWRNRTSRKPIVGGLPVTVSLTSYGERLRTVALAIESIAAGTAQPARLILWLDHDVKLPGGELPQSLRRLQRRGLEICETLNVGPHGKYFGYVNSVPRHEFPLVTADDDIMYPRRWLEGLFHAHRLHPHEIHCHWAKQLTTANGTIGAYEDWPVVEDTTARMQNFALGVSGVIYPPAMLNELARRGGGFENSCPKADDLWLHWTALQCGVKIRQIGITAHHFPLIPGTQKTALRHVNVADGGNDACIEKLYTEGDIDALNCPMAEHQSS